MAVAGGKPAAAAVAAAGSSAAGSFAVAAGSFAAAGNSVAVVAAGNFVAESHLNLTSSSEETANKDQSTH
jgi:hypothetical protein